MNEKLKEEDRIKCYQGERIPAGFERPVNRTGYPQEEPHVHSSAPTPSTSHQRQVKTWLTGLSITQSAANTDKSGQSVILLLIKRI